MNKRELAKLPCTAPDWMFKKAKNTEKNTFLLRRKFGNVATYEFYLTGKLEKGDVVPEFIVFKEKHDWVNYSPKEERWTNAKFENARINMEQNGRIYYSTYYISQYEILRNLRKWQEKIGQKRYKERVRKERERVQKTMDLVPELPDDFMDFVENKVMKQANYIIYNRKKDTAYCTRCNEKYALKELEIRNSTKAEHMKEYQFCPKCRVWMRQLSSGLSRNGKEFRRGLEIMQKHGSGVVVREFVVTRDFEKVNGEKLETMLTKVTEIHRYTADRKGHRDYEKIADDEKWEDRTGKTFRIFGPRDGLCYSKNIKKVLKGTDFGYEGIGEIIRAQIDKTTYNGGMESVIKRAAEHPYLEQFIKAGLKELAVCDMEEKLYYAKINEKETKVTKMLGINKGELRIIREAEKQEVALEVIQLLKKQEKTASEELIQELYRTKENGAERYSLEKIIEKNACTVKSLKYINEKEITAGDFLDHLELMEKLGIPRKKNNIYPDDFKMIHQEEIEEDILRSEEKIAGTIRKKFKKTYGRWKNIIEKNKVITEENGYRIVLPENPVDIKVEGRCLHHCVGNYVDGAAEGRTFIFYVRKSENIRLYTAEYKNGMLIQIRASYNDAPEEEARKLAEKFAKELAAAEKKEEKSEKKRTKSTKQTAIAV